MWNSFRTDAHLGTVAEITTYAGGNGELIHAYVARPMGDGPVRGTELGSHFWRAPPPDWIGQLDCLSVWASTTPFHSLPPSSAPTGPASRMKFAKVSQFRKPLGRTRKWVKGSA